MRVRNKPYHRLLNFLTPVCFLLFVILFFYGASLYPGGSYRYPLNEGYDMVNNYICNLMGTTALNGSPNPGRTVSIVSWVALGTGVGFFFYHFADRFKLSLLFQKVIRISGILSMIFILLTFTSWHDTVVSISGLFGALSISALLISLKREQKHLLYLFGWIVLLLILYNAISYFIFFHIEALPFIQKITLICVLIWFTILNKHYSQRSIS
ncbi:MAG: hypothetical protein EP305_08100 [Bacteroidetes bacterium]|nr:MAG: hypothetical protein EP305_08100 [Bacteroidota bacterium]